MTQPSQPSIAQAVKAHFGRHPPGRGHTGAIAFSGYLAAVDPRGQGEAKGLKMLYTFTDGSRLSVSFFGVMRVL